MFDLSDPILNCQQRRSLEASGIAIIVVETNPDLGLTKLYKAFAYSGGPV